MKIHYMFSRNKKIGSKLISWSGGLLVKDLEKIPSHGCILIEFVDSSEGIIFESTLDAGVRLVPFSAWLTHNEVCYMITPKEQPNMNKVLGIVSKMWGKKYDYPGILYFALSFIALIVFKRPFPKSNNWSSRDKYFCLEAMFEICEYEKSGMATPAKMCSDLLKREV
jgi:hypothetical protein